MRVCLLPFYLVNKAAAHGNAFTLFEHIGAPVDVTQVGRFDSCCSVAHRCDKWGGKNELCQRLCELIIKKHTLWEVTMKRSCCATQRIGLFFYRTRPFFSPRANQ